MPSPPKSHAINPVHGQVDGHTGTPRGSSRYDEQERKWFRVRVDGEGRIDPVVVQADATGNPVATTPFLFDNRLTYVLEARDRRKIPIPAVDLADWLNRHYRVGASKKSKIPSVYVRRDSDHGMFPGSRVEDVPLHRGAWWIKQSDTSVLTIPQMHTLPLAELVFELDRRGTVRAHYPKKKTTPTAVEFGDMNSGEGHTENH